MADGTRRYNPKNLVDLIGQDVIKNVGELNDEALLAIAGYLQAQNRTNALVSDEVLQSQIRDWRSSRPGHEVEKETARRGVAATIKARVTGIR